jgi:hypothetical protein
MGGDRLTKNELSWLFAQEAKSAASKLRAGVTMPPPPPDPAITILPGEVDTAQSVEGALNRLDEAVSALTSLHTHPIARGRRGKIDVAALLWEIAPEAKVQIEMGEGGTTVFGDEAELRRMLQVLIAQSGDPAGGSSSQEIAVRRKNDSVWVEVPLGPDTPATHETERAWLSRMAVRYGGRLELEGGVQRLALAADVDETARELVSLKKELAAAQAQGEAYARELAALFSKGEASGGPASIPSRPSHRAPGDDSLAVLVAALRSIGAELRGILSAVGREIAPLRGHSGEVGESASSVSRHVTAASEVLSDLARVGAFPLGELPRVVDLVEMLRDILRDETARTARHDVKVELIGVDSALDVVPAGGLFVLLHALFAHALDATPPGETITIFVDAPQSGVLDESSQDIAITFQDAGAPLAGGALSGVLSREFETLAPGRRSSVALIAAHAIAAHLRMRLSIENTPDQRRGARVRLDIPRSS